MKNTQESNKQRNIRVPTSVKGDHPGHHFVKGEVSVQLSPDPGRAALWVERKRYLKIICVVCAHCLKAGTKPEALSTLMALLGKI